MPARKYFDPRTKKAILPEKKPRPGRIFDPKTRKATQLPGERPSPERFFDPQTRKATQVPGLMAEEEKEQKVTGSSLTSKTLLGGRYRGRHRKESSTSLKRYLLGK
jgi:hypothetical protein